MKWEGSCYIFKCAAYKKMFHKQAYFLSPSELRKELNVETVMMEKKG